MSVHAQVLGALAKGHDAAIALFLGAMRIIESNETITGLKLAQMTRTVRILSTAACVLLYV